MFANFYVISLPPGHLIATEVASDEAAVALDLGQVLLLARPIDLVRVALRHDRQLTIRFREHAAAPPFGFRRPSPMPAPVDDTSPPFAVRSRYQSFWKDWQASLPASNALGSTSSQAALVAAAASN